MKPSEIKPGMKFGEWEVVRFSHKDSHYNYLCKCSCGKTGTVRGCSLVKGLSNSCNKCPSVKKGDKFYLLTVKSTYRENNRTKVVCKCKCGNTVVVTMDNLKRGHHKSCGCNRWKIKNLKGMRFGRLKAIEHTGLFRHGQAEWKCRCDCGKYTTTTSNQLLRGSTLSCGCLGKQNRLNGIQSSRKYPVGHDYAKYYRANLSDSYIKNLLCQRSGLSTTNIPDELIEIMRAHIHLKREIQRKERKNGKK